MAFKCFLKRLQKWSIVYGVMTEAFIPWMRVKMILSQRQRCCHANKEHALHPVCFPCNCLVWEYSLTSVSPKLVMPHQGRITAVACDTSDMMPLIRVIIRCCIWKILLKNSSRSKEYQREKDQRASAVIFWMFIFFTFF